MEHLLAIWRDARRAGREDEAARRLLHERVIAVQVLMQRVPLAGLRERIRVDTLSLALSPPGDTRSWEERRVDRIFVCADAIASLGAYLREEPLPSPAGRVVEVRGLWPFTEAGTDKDAFIWESENASGP
jgi:hypothetical protein